MVGNDQWISQPFSVTVNSPVPAVWKFQTNFLSYAWKTPKFSKLISDLKPNLAEIFPNPVLTSNRIIQGPLRTLVKQGNILIYVFVTFADALVLAVMADYGSTIDSDRTN